MSVVVWDGKTLAADRQATNAGLRRTISKMKRLSDGTVLAWVGSQDTGLAMARWYEAGHDFECYPAGQRDKEDWSSLIAVLPDRRILVFEKWEAAIEILDEQMAWGSGRDFALGAMAMGANARRAVEIASQFSIDCGCGVEAFDVAPLALVQTGD
jgi:ATP-dependent protease HslVU (ClpYQ) peptidase subunit